MPFSAEQIDELAILARFNLTTSLEGIKVHSHTADPSAVAAAERLFKRGFVTQVDGGYLTDLGRESAEHIQALRILLSSDSH